MKAKLRHFRDTLQNSYWFVPAVMAVAAAGLAVAMVSLDGALGYEMVETIRWIYTGGPDGAREVLSTVAGSMITVAGVAFSITIVALALASAQFGPRLLSNFMRDTGNQIVLGTFIATFIYSLMVLRTIRTDDEGVSFVPYIAVTVSILLAVMSLGVLIYFIHHASVSIQAPHLVATVARELHEGIDELFPEDVNRSGVADPDTTGELPEEFETRADAVLTRHGGYIDGIDFDALMEIATEHDLLIRVEHRPGGFLVHGTAVARVWPPQSMDDVIERTIRRAFITTFHRSSLQDIEFSVNQLVEVALRALSPALNDPFTAIACVDYLSAGLCHLANRRMPQAFRFDDQHRLRVVARKPLTFVGVVDAAFNQIRQNAAFHTAVYIRLMGAIATVVDSAPSEAVLSPLIRQAEMIRTAGLSNIPEPADQEDLEERYRYLVEAVERRRVLLSAGALEPVD